MSVFNKKENFNISIDSKIFNPQTVMDFIYAFSKEFSMEIIGVDANAEERTFKIHFLYYKSGIQIDTIIEYSNYNEKLSYFIETKGLDELGFRSNYKNQIEFIKTYL